MYTLLENEQEGDFTAPQSRINLATEGEYRIQAQGGFTPYSFALIDGPNGGKGSIDGHTGLYKAPKSEDLSGDSVEVTVEVIDESAHRDRVDITVYKPMGVTPNLVNITEGDGVTIPMHIEGGVAPFTYGWEGEEKTPISDRDFSFDPHEPSSPPPGQYFIEIKDAIRNTVFVRVEVNAAGVLLINPDYITVETDEADEIEFEVSGGSTIPADPLLLSDPEAGSVEWNSDAKKITFEPSPPLGEGSSFYITIRDDADSTARTDIFVQEEDELAPLEISPSTAMAPSGATLTFTASGGIKPYTFSTIPDKNTVNRISEDEVEVTLNSPPWTATLRVEDKMGNRAEADLEIGD